ncbi:MAG: SDR family oxidoreductase [Spirochaetales bacterium]|nr:SDR family oxidoreductase [Spirochaetales bacterium]
MPKRLRGKIALVTGASKGIGRAAALALAREGASVAVTARSRDPLEQVAREIRSLGVEALASTGDAVEAGDVARIRDEVLANLGHVDVLVNNVGIAKYAPFEEISLEDYDWMMNTNMRSSFLFTKAFLPGMLERGEGWVVFVASVSGLYGYPGETAYCASKHAQLGFAKALEREVNPRGVKVSVIAPGGVNTEHAFGTGRTPRDENLATFIEPEDVAEAVVFSVTQPEKTRISLVRMRPMSEGLYD